MPIVIADNNLTHVFKIAQKVDDIFFENLIEVIVIDERSTCQISARSDHGNAVNFETQNLQEDRHTDNRS